MAGPAVGTKEVGGKTMSACILRMEGQADDPAALCNYMQQEGTGFFAENADEASVSAAVEAYESQSREAVGSQAAGALLRGRRKVESLVSFAESSKISLDLREVRCKVLVEGLGNARDKHFYGPESIDDTVDLINQGGVRCFLNHQTEAEHRERSEGDIRVMAGYWKDAIAETQPDGRRAAVATLVLDDSTAGEDLLMKVQASLKYATDFPNIREVYAGLSINGDGEVDPRKVIWQGQEVEVNYVREVSELPSIDGVTRPAREGQFLKLLESIQNANPEEAQTMKKKELKASAARITEAAAKVDKGELSVEEYQKILEAENSKMKAMKTAADKPKEGEAEDEAEGDKPKPKVETEDAEAEAEDEAEGEDDVEKDGEEPGDKADAPGGTKTHVIKHEEKMTQKEAVAALKKLRAENVLVEARAQKAERRLSEQRIAKQLAEAGLTDVEGMSAADLATLPAAMRRVVIGSVRATRESGSFGFGGSTPRSAGSDRNASAGDGFAALCESR